MRSHRTFWVMTGGKPERQWNGELPTKVERTKIEAKADLWMG